MTLLDFPGVYITADTHFGHKNIVKYCNRPENHDALMEENWNKVVSVWPKESIVLHLGDFAFMKADQQNELLSRLNGKKLLVLGNHDKSFAVMENIGFEVLTDRGGYSVTPMVDFTLVFSHEPVDEKELRKVFNKFGHPVLNIHGHVHNNEGDKLEFKEVGKSLYRINVSVEVTNYRPIPLDSIVIDFRRLLNG